MNLIDANKPRAILIADAITQRLGDQAGEWTGYNPDEGLEGILVTDTLLRYNRPGHNSDAAQNYALLFFHEPKLADIKEVDWGEYNPVQKDIIERENLSIDKIKGVNYKDTLSHTFSKTTTLNEAFKIGAEVAVKAYFKGSYAGVEGGAEISAKLTAEYNRQWGSEETHTDSVQREIELPPETEGKIIFEAVRSVDKMERHIKATSNIDYGINYVSGPMIPPENHPLIDFNWTSLQQFIDIAQGNAAADKPMYHQFMSNPLYDDNVQEIQDAGEQSIDFTLNYDNVTSQEIRITR